MKIKIGEEYNLDNLLDKNYKQYKLPPKIIYLNGFRGKLEGQLLLEDIQKLPGILPWRKEDFKKPLQVLSPDKISYQNCSWYKWNILYPFGIPLTKGNVADLSALNNQFKEVNVSVYIINPEPDLILVPEKAHINDKQVYFPLAIELSVNGKSVRI